MHYTVVPIIMHNHVSFRGLVSFRASVDTKLDSWGQTKRATYILKQFLLVDIQKVEGQPLGREESQPLFTKRKKKEHIK